MPQLAVVYSSYLEELLGQRQHVLDAVELTYWQPLPALTRILPGLEGCPLYFHASNLTDRLMLLPGVRTELAKILQLTGARWFSAHISLLPPGLLWLVRGFNIHLPLPPLDRLLDGFIGKVDRIKRENPGIPLLLENMPVEPSGVYKHLKSPALIREVLERTDCGFLLDLPHARIAAEALGMDTIEYLRQLPLERVVEIHTSGPARRSDGILIDRHRVMQAADYELLRWALTHTPVQVVTLEYFKDREGLATQLPELARIIKKETYP